MERGEGCSPALASHGAERWLRLNFRFLWGDSQVVIGLCRGSAVGVTFLVAPQALARGLFSHPPPTPRPVSLFPNQLQGGWGSAGAPSVGKIEQPGRNWFFGSCWISFCRVLTLAVCRLRLAPINPAKALASSGQAPCLPASLFPVKTPLADFSERTEGPLLTPSG